MEEKIKFFLETNEQDQENLIYFYDKLLKIDPDFFSQAEKICENPNGYEEMIQKMQEMEIKNPQLRQMEEERLRKLFPNDQKFQKGLDLVLKFNKNIVIKKYNNSNIQDNKNSPMLNSEKIKQMLKGENVGKLGVFGEDMIDLGIKKDTNENKNIAQKFNNQNNIRKVNSNQIFAPFQQLNFNMFITRGPQINNTSLSKAQYLVNEDDRLGRGIIDDFRPIKFRSTTMPRPSYINPPIIPKIQGNRSIYNLKDFL